MNPMLSRLLGELQNFNFDMNVSPPQLRIPIDIVNDEKETVIYADLSGIDRSTINVDFFNNKLLIRAEKTKSYSSVPQVSEIKYGKLERTITLPFAVTKKEAVSTSYNNGMLIVKINKDFEYENKFSITL